MNHRFPFSSVKFCGLSCGILWQFVEKFVGFIGGCLCTLGESRVTQEVLHATGGTATLPQEDLIFIFLCEITRVTVD